MAYFRKRKKGWSAEIEKNGIRESKTFETKAQAISWATHRESEILSGIRNIIPTKSFSDAIDKYINEISVKKKGYRWEKIRLEKIKREADFVNMLMSKINTSHLAKWRDNRLNQVSPASVNRELNLIQAIFNVAKDEWLWVKETPFKGLKRPKNPPPRNRRISDKEIALICNLLSFDENLPIKLKKQEVALIFLLAIETAMRAGEMIQLKWKDVKEKRVILHDTKNGDKREVPLSIRARELLSLMRDIHPERVFSIESGSLDVIFRRARDLASSVMPELKTLHFHDTRHEACTRLAQKVSVLELARIIGHRDLKSLMIYYNPTSEELADKLG